ncbi:hypothetical protein KAI52_01110 [Candidatus Parcubacteria bacterium]|nr:hypothetical protein [Candidatus Parcubacteria bacterium]
MKNIKNNFFVAIKKSFAAYKKYGARSTKKLIPIHKFLAETILQNLNNHYSVKSLGVGDGKEFKFNGKYMPKNLDISVFKNKKFVATVSFKFVTSNYKQNVNNYFENLLGETANIRRQNVGFAHFLVLRGHTPYLSKNRGNLRGKEMKTEILNEKNLEKYVKLFCDLDFPHKPELLGICILDFDKKGNPYFVNLDEFSFANETKKLLKTNFTLENFLKKFIHLVKLKS